MGEGNLPLLHIQQLFLYRPMSEATQNQDSDLIQSPEVELANLKAKADLMGVKYHPSISFDKLLQKVREALEAADKPAEPEAEVTEDPAEKRARLRAEAMKLVRVNITCMNPFKREWDSEIITVGNSYVGSVKRCVPFNTPDGWHIEQIMLNAMRERMCQVFVNEKAPNGQTIRKGKLIKEFAIEVLPPLTEQELKELARRQAIARVED